MEPVETLRPNGSYEPLRYTIRLWCPKRSAHDLDLLGPKHLVEARSEFPISVPNEEPDVFRAIGQGPRQLPGLLRDPLRCRRRRAAGNMHPATAQFNKEEHVEPLQPDRLHCEEIHGEQTPTVRAHELAPTHPASRADRSDTSFPKPGANR